MLRKAYTNLKEIAQVVCLRNKKKFNVQGQGKWMGEGGTAKQEAWVQVQARWRTSVVLLLKAMGPLQVFKEVRPIVWPVFWKDNWLKDYRRVGNENLEMETINSWVVHDFPEHSLLLIGDVGSIRDHLNWQQVLFFSRHFHGPNLCYGQNPFGAIISGTAWWPNLMRWLLSSFFAHVLPGALFSTPFCSVVCGEDQAPTVCVI